VKSDRPTKDDLISARGSALPDVIAPGLKVLFCGINPGLWSGAVGHHFARPGNRFWAVLFRARFTDALLAPAEEKRLLAFGCGITNIVDFATAQARELSAQMLREGAAALERKVALFHPRILAVLGIDAYRRAFARPAAGPGRQDRGIGDTEVWVLPNPSGINANYQIDDLARVFSELRMRAEEL
jgi:double-stranded uracil-DNA glycosylase